MSICSGACRILDIDHESLVVTCHFSPTLVRRMVSLTSNVHLDSKAAVIGDGDLKNY
jgi:hypothetical protein